MKYPLLRSLAALTFAAATGPALAGSYSQNFNAFANGLTMLGDGTFISSSPFNASACGVQTQRLRMSSDAITGTLSIFRLAELDPGYEVNGFDVQFDMQLTSGNPADGMSLVFGALPLSDSAGPGEEGYQLPGGMVVSFDTYINNPPETTRSIDVTVDGIQVATLPEASFGNFDLTGAVRHVTVHWDAAGLDVVWRNVATATDYVVCNNLPVPGLAPSPGDRFAFSARTGGLAETLDLDNLVVTTTTVPPIATPEVAFSELNIDNTKNEDEHCNTPGWVEIYNGTATTRDLSTYSLTDDAGTPARWTFPAGTMLGAYQYRVIYFGYDGLHPNADSRLHASFAPVKTGGYLGLYNGGVLVDSWNPYPPQAADVSYGYFGAARTLGFMETPTPALRNSGLQAAGPPVNEDVVWPRDGGLITGPLSLTLGAPLTAGGEIRYTLDNTAPLPSSTLYTAPISVTTSTNVRARIYAPARLPGKVSSRTFLKLDSSITDYRGTGQPFNSNLPVVIIDSFGRSLDAENSATPGARPYRYTYNVVLDRDPANGNRTRVTETQPDDGSPPLTTRAPVNFQGRSGMRVRGESSSGMPQRQYAWETQDNEGHDKNASILGLPADSDWVLYAPATDKSLLRNYLVYNSMFLLDGQGSAVRAKLVEVFFSQPALGGVSTDTNPEITWADYRGVYVLLERIKRGKDRVDIAKLAPCDTSASLITGGYIFKKDKASTDPDFTTANGQLLQITEPATTVGDAQYTYLNTYMNQFETALYGANYADPVTGYRAYIDEQSFQDNEWWVEIFKQIDGYRLSTYFYKDRGQKVKSAPLWDYNLSMGNADYLAGWNYQGWYRDAGISSGQSGNTDYQYYWRLRQDAGYLRRLWDRYWKIRAGVLTTPALMARINAAVAEVTDGQPAVNIKNSAAWVITNYSDPANTPQLWPASTPSVETPAARHHSRWQRLGIYDWPNAPGIDSRDYFVSSTDAADLAAITATPYNVTTPPAMSEAVHIKGYMTNRLAWIDDANFAGSTNTILRPPLFSQSGGNVTAPYNLTITPYTGTAPAAANYSKTGTLNYATGPVYYTTDGTDPAAAAVIPGVTRHFVTDTNACSVVLPTSATLGGTDTSSRDWKAWDFNTASMPAGAPAWKTGLNGVGYDVNITTSPSYYPYINILMASSVLAGATPVPPVIYGSNMQNVNGSAYIRLPFTLTAADIAGLNKFRLYGHVDDGFVAYVNNVKIAESNAPASPAWNSIATALQPGSDNDGIIYKEFTTSNDAAAFAALRAGTNVLAIHGLNGTAISSSDFIQRYMLDAETLSSTPPSATAQLYTTGVTISSGVTIKARQFDTATGTVTPMTEGTFVANTVPATAANLVVSEIMYNPTAPTLAEAAAGFNNANMFEYIEVQNIGTLSVDLSAVSIADGITFTWPVADPNLRVLAPGTRAVVVGNAGAFALRYAPGPAVKVAGVFSGNLSNGGEHLLLSGSAGTIKDFTYDDDPPWPGEPDGTGYSLVLNHPASNPNHNLPQSWRASLQVNGTPGAAAGPSGPTGSAAAALADTDGDGMSDLIEYATGTLGNNGASQHWPTTGSMSSTPPGGTAGDYLTFSYTRSRSADGFTFEPEVSTALTGWMPLSTLFTFVSQMNNADGTATLKWRSTLPAAALPSRIFLQVRAGITP